jgi:hypothetical protein
MYDNCKFYPLWIPPCTETPTIIENDFERASRILGEFINKISIQINDLAHDMVIAFSKLLGENK